MKRFLISMKTKIEFETSELTVVRIRRSQTVLASCPRCNAKVSHFSVIRAAAILQISETAVFRLAESGTVHSSETAAGALLICGISISELAKEFKL